MPHVIVKFWPSPAILRGTNSRVGRIRPEKSPSLRMSAAQFAVYGLPADVASAVPSGSSSTLL